MRRSEQEQSNVFYDSELVENFTCHKNQAIFFGQVILKMNATACSSVLNQVSTYHHSTLPPSYVLLWNELTRQNPTLLGLYRCLDLPCLTRKIESTNYEANYQ